MKGKIDNNGMLRIYRGDANPDHYQHQYCPFHGEVNTSATWQIGFMKPCGCWCPLFGEPEKSRNEHFIKIEICHGKTLVFNEFADER